MKIGIASDHTGVSAREKVRDLLDRLGLEYQDFGCPSEAPVDYPDMAEAVANAVSRKECDLGILICGTGVGMSIAANKVRGVLAAVCHDEFTAEMARKHNHANVLCLGARVLTEDEIARLVDIWLKTEPDGGRHERRVEKMLKIEGRNLDADP